MVLCKLRVQKKHELNYFACIEELINASFLSPFCTETRESPQNNVSWSNTWCNTKTNVKQNKLRKSFVYCGAIQAWRAFSSHWSVHVQSFCFASINLPRRTRSLETPRLTIIICELSWNYRKQSHFCSRNSLKIQSERVLDDWSINYSGKLQHVFTFCEMRAAPIFNMLEKYELCG